MRSRHEFQADTYRTVKSVFRGGSHGVLLLLNCVEMKPERPSAAGEDLRELGLA